MSGDDVSRVAAALDDLGWRAASDVPAAEVAPMVVAHLAAYSRHGDLARCRRGIAEELRRHAHALDGSLSSVADWEPMASAVARRAAGEPPGTA